MKAVFLLFHNFTHAVGVVTRLWTGHSGVGIPSGGKRLFPSSKRLRQLWGSPCLPFHGYWVFFPRV